MISRVELTRTLVSITTFSSSSNDSLQKALLVGVGDVHTRIQYRPMTVVKLICGGSTLVYLKKRLYVQVYDSSLVTRYLLPIPIR